MIWLLLAILLASAGAWTWMRGSAGRPCWVYVIPSRSSRRPAYVGHGYDPDARLAAHCTSSWADDIDHSRPHRRERYPNKRLAYQRERALVRRLDPLHNKIRYTTVR